MAIDAPPPETGTSPSLASPQAAPEMTVDQDEGDVYGGFERFQTQKVAVRGALVYFPKAALACNPA